MIWTSAALASLSSGLIVAGAGYTTLGLLGVALLIPPAAVLLARRRARRRRPARLRSRPGSLARSNRPRHTGAHANHQTARSARRARTGGAPAARSRHRRVRPVVLALRHPVRVADTGGVRPGRGCHRRDQRHRRRRGGQSAQRHLHPHPDAGWVPRHDPHRRGRRVHRSRRLGRLPDHDHRYRLRRGGPRGDRPVRRDWSTSSSCSPRSTASAEPRDPDRAAAPAPMARRGP